MKTLTGGGVRATGGCGGPENTEGCALLTSWNPDQGRGPCRCGSVEASCSLCALILLPQGCRRPLKSPRLTVSPRVCLGLGACLLGESWGLEGCSRGWSPWEDMVGPPQCQGEPRSRPLMSPGPRRGMGAVDGEAGRAGLDSGPEDATGARQPWELSWSWGDGGGGGGENLVLTGFTTEVD